MNFCLRCEQKPRLTALQSSAILRISEISSSLASPQTISPACKDQRRSRSSVRVSCKCLSCSSIRWREPTDSSLSVDRAPSPLLSNRLYQLIFRLSTMVMIVASGLQVETHSSFSNSISRHKLPHRLQLSLTACSSSAPRTWLDSSSSNSGTMKINLYASPMQEMGWQYIELIRLEITRLRSNLPQLHRLQKHWILYRSH